MDQESGARLDAMYMKGQEPTEEPVEEYLGRVAALIDFIALVNALIPSETLDQWEREQYNRLKLEQETSNDLEDTGRP